MFYKMQCNCWDLSLTQSDVDRDTATICLKHFPQSLLNGKFNSWGKA